jgi:hypothetical protein
MIGSKAKKSFMFRKCRLYQCEVDSLTKALGQQRKPRDTRTVEHANPLMLSIASQVFACCRFTLKTMVILVDKYIPPHCATKTDSDVQHAKAQEQER